MRATGRVFTACQLIRPVVPMCQIKKIRTDSALLSSLVLRPESSCRQDFQSIFTDWKEYKKQDVRRVYSFFIEELQQDVV